MFKITDQQFQQLAALEATNSPTRYADIYDLIDGWLENPDPFGFGAPGNLQAWFGAAAQANRGEGAASDFIRTYTEAQLEIRSGENIANVDTLLQGASNAIAQAVFDDIEESRDSDNGEVFYTIPDLTQIGNQDASQTLAALPGFSNPAIWSGNLLFIGLGDSSFWSETALEDPGDTYDIAVAARSAVAAGTGALFSGGFGELMAQFWFQGPEGRSDAAAAAATALDGTTAFWQDAYGVYGESGTSGLAFTGITFGLTVGSDEDDFSLEQQGLAGRYFVHGGRGNDLIVGTRGTGVLDGGTGFDDIVSFESGNVGSLTASLFFVDSTARFSANVVGDNLDAAIFNTETLSLGGEDDVLNIDTSTLTNSSINRVNAAGQSGIGDTIRLDGNFVTQAVQVSLENETVSIAEGGSLSLVGFENIIGSRYRDTLTGDEGENIIEGGADRDTVSGGAGDDWLRGGDGRDKLRGDEDDDILEGQQGKDNLRGGDGNDLLFASQYFENVSNEIASSSTLRGERDDDILVADAGGNTLQGGRDNDILIGGDGNDVLRGGRQSDLIIAQGGTDEIYGGRGDDWIKALDDQGSAIVYFDKNGGNDFIEGDGVSEIRFTGLNINEVELIWDYEYSNDYEDSGDDYGEADEEFFEFYEGEAIIRVKETGASINIGNLIGTEYNFDYPDLPDDGVPAYFEDFTLDLDAVPTLVFEDATFTDMGDDTLFEYSYLVNWGGRPFIDDGVARPIFSFKTIREPDDNDVFEVTGAMALEDIKQGNLSDYDQVKDNFSSEFSGAFASLPTDLSGSFDLANILTAGTLETLTTDVFDFV